MKYLVTDANFWEKLPYFQELSCGRVRFSKERFDTSFRSDIRVQDFESKGLALNKVFHSPPGTWLIREQQYSEDRWIYEALIGKTPPGSSDEGD